MCKATVTQKPEFLNLSEFSGYCTSENPHFCVMVFTHFSPTVTQKKIKFEIFFLFFQKLTPQHYFWTAPFLHFSPELDIYTAEKGVCLANKQVRSVLLQSSQPTKNQENNLFSLVLASKKRQESRKKGGNPSEKIVFY